MIYDFGQTMFSLKVHIYAAAQAYTVHIGCGPKKSCDSLVNTAKSGCEHSWADVQVDDSFHECRRHKTVKYLEMIRFMGVGVTRR